VIAPAPRNPTKENHMTTIARLLTKIEARNQTISRDDGATYCLAEWYEKNPATGERGWRIHAGWIAGARAEVRAGIEARPHFDAIVDCYEANPNGGERPIAELEEYDPSEAGDARRYARAENGWRDA
jgi:hypothetical protein